MNSTEYLITFVTFKQVLTWVRLTDLDLSRASRLKLINYIISHHWNWATSLASKFIPILYYYRPLHQAHMYAWFPHIVWCCQWCLFDIREHIHSYFLFYYSDCKCHIVYLLPSFLSRKFSLRDYGLLCFISQNTCNISKTTKNNRIKSKQRKLCSNLIIQYFNYSMI